MKKVAIIYWSGTGNTQAMAELVAEGAKSTGAEVTLFTPGDFSAAQVAEYTAIGLGCPSMGSEQLEESEFEPMYQAIRGALSGKAVALFGSYGWGSGEWMEEWSADCRGAGVSMVADPVIVNNAPEGDGAEDCKSLGVALGNA